MEFRTKVPIAPEDPKMDYQSKLLLLGSCFVENIGEKLSYFKFQQLLNPFGILFHPEAILNFLDKVAERHRFTEADIFYDNETWKSFDAHSMLNASDKERLLSNLNSAVEETNEFLRSATHVVITPGTAWGYRLKDSGALVANCHKQPQRRFTKELTEIESTFVKCVQILKDLNPDISIIFTLSPVRHIKDGFVENQRSKARLLTAIHEVVSDQKQVFYFPSYEIMMDELRDYRFYGEDMIHPNKTAIDYIWERFTDTWISADAAEIMKRVDVIQKGLAHRSFNPTSQAHLQFRRDLEQKIERIREEVPGMTF